MDKVYPIGADAWAVEMAPAFAEASLEELRAAADARSFDDMNTLLLGGTIGDGTDALGDAAADLVYVPITPCRIFDTRLAGGQIAANGVRAFDVTAVSNYSSQGGSASNCEGAGAAGSFAAAEINFTVVAPAAAGFITAFPVGTAQPPAATLNYEAGAIRGNDVVVKLDQSSATNELNVYSFAATHLVGDLVGYYTAPAPTILECEDKKASCTLLEPNGVFDLYTLTGGSCVVSPNASLQAAEPIAGVFMCIFRNEGGGPANAKAHGRCCRVPGR